MTVGLEFSFKPLVQSTIPPSFNEFHVISILALKIIK